MEAWENAVRKFLVRWMDRDEVMGALVCGSYVTGEPTDRSDIDLHIILADSAKWRERGNKYVDGFLIEYFANPPRQIRSYFAGDFAYRRTASLVQFITGKIIFDSQGIVVQLKDEAAAWKGKKYPAPDTHMAELTKYHLWDTYDNLLDCYENQRLDFDFLYNHSLFQLFEGYCALLNIEKIPFDQISRYLSDPGYLRKYLKAPFPDGDFSRMFLEALKVKGCDDRMRLYKSLFTHALKKSGEFEIDGWRLRTPVLE